jgi:hypothetical protein
MIVTSPLPAIASSCSTGTGGTGNAVFVHQFDETASWLMELRRSRLDDGHELAVLFLMNLSDRRVIDVAVHQRYTAHYAVRLLDGAIHRLGRPSLVRIANLDDAEVKKLAMWGTPLGVLVQPHRDRLPKRTYGRHVGRKDRVEAQYRANKHLYGQIVPDRFN